MKILQGNPPNLDKIIKAGLKPDPDKTVFTYGDTIYNPGKGIIDPLLMKHEEIHSRQQGNDPDGWWDRYLKDINFRLAQELEAYGIQYKEAEKIIKDRNGLSKLLRLLANDLSGEMYGKILTFQEAIIKIKNAENSKPI